MRLACSMSAYAVRVWATDTEIFVLVSTKIEWVIITYAYVAEHILKSAELMKNYVIDDNSMSL